MLQTGIPVRWSGHMLSFATYYDESSSLLRERYVLNSRSANMNDINPPKFRQGRTFLEYSSPVLCRVPNWRQKAVKPNKIGGHVHISSKRDWRVQPRNMRSCDQWRGAAARQRDATVCKIEPKDAGFNRIAQILIKGAQWIHYLFWNKGAATLTWLSYICLTGTKFDLPQWSLVVFLRNFHLESGQICSAGRFLTVVESSAALFDKNREKQDCEIVSRSGRLGEIFVLNGVIANDEPICSGFAKRDNCCWRSNFRYGIKQFFFCRRSLPWRMRNHCQNEDAARELDLFDAKSERQSF